MEHFLTVEFLGVLVLTIIVSAVVALMARHKTLGYGWAFFICFALSIFLVLMRLPFPIPIAAFMSAAVFFVWPKKDMSAEAKN